MKIKKATIAELSNLSLLFDAYRVFYNKTSDKKSAQKFLNARLESNESEIFVSYNTDGVMTGFTQLYSLFSSTRMKRLWLLNDLYVHPDFRGQGFSIALIKRAKQLCRETNACGMMLETGIDNKIGNQLYPRTGFKLNQETNFYSWDV